MRNKRLFAALLSAMLAVSSVFPMGTASTVFAAEAAEIMETEETDTAAEEETAAQASADEEETGEEESALIEEETDNGEETTADPDEEDADAGLSGEEADAAGEEADSAEEDAGLAGEEGLAEEAEADAEATEGTTEEVAAPEEEAGPAVIEEEAPAEEITKPEMLDEVFGPYSFEKQGTVDSSQPSSDELFAAYVNQKFGIEDEGKFRKSNMGAKLTGMDKVFYDYISGELPKIEQGTRSSTEFILLAEELEKQKWYAEDIGVSAIIVDGAISDEALNALYDTLMGDINKVVGALLADHPYLLYWFNKTRPFQVGLRSLYYGVRSDTNGHYFNVSGELYYRLYVANEYAAGDLEVDTSIGATVRASAANARSVVSRYSSYSDYDKLHHYMDAICDMVDYNHAAADDDNTPYGNPWQMIWVFDDDPTTKVVCEGYSKAFQYLCDESAFNGDITCYSVTGLLGAGTGAGRHMWNIVTMENGLNYLVDVTNSDTGSVGEGDWLFLAGTNGSVEGGYVFDADGEDVPFTYDSGIISFYTSSILKLADTYYRPAPTIQIEDGDVSLSDTEFVYDGTGKQPEVTVVHDGTVLTEGTDFTVEYSQNINAGDAVAIVRGIGGYSGTVEKPFTIKKAKQFLEVDPTELTTDPYNYTEVAVIGTNGEIGVFSDNPNVATAAFNTDLIAVTRYSGDAASSGLPYQLAMINPLSTGNALITFTVAGDENHEEAVARLLVTVVKGDLTNFDRCEMRIEPYSFEYTGYECQPAVTVIYNRQPLRMEWDYDFYYENNVDPGEGYVVVTGCGMFTGTVRIPFTISGPAPQLIDISIDDDVDFTIVGANDLVYDGREKKPEVIMLYQGVPQELGTDYTVEYIDNINAGEAKAVVTGIGRFTGSIPLIFTIKKAELRMLVDPEELVTDPWNITEIAVIGVADPVAVQVSSDDPDVANASMYSDIEPVTHYSGNAGSSGLPYVLATITPKAVGSTVIKFTVEESENYLAGEVSLPVTVNKGDFTSDRCKVTIDPTSFEYTGEPCEPTVTVTYNRQVLLSDWNYSWNYYDNVGPGEGYVVVTGYGNYTGEVRVPFEIREQAPIDISNNPDIMIRKDPEYNLVYDGQPKTPKIFMYYQDELQEEGVDYTYTFRNNVNAGTAYVTVTGMGRFTGSLQRWFTIEKAQQHLTVDPAELIVDPYNITQVALIGIREGRLTASSSNREIVDVDINSNITPVTPYHGDAQNGDEPYRLVTIKPKKAGTARITFAVVGSPNYQTPPVTLQVTVVEGDLSQDWCGVSLEQTEYTYSGEACEPAVSVRYYNETLTEGVDYEVTYESNVNAGTAVAIITGIGSFVQGKAVEFTIKKAQQKLILDPDELTVDPWNVTEIAVFGGNTRITITSDHEDVAVATFDAETIPITPYTGYSDSTIAMRPALVFPKAVGNALITFSAEESDNFEAAETSLLVTVVKGDLTRDRCEVTVTPASFEYTGEPCEPSVTVTYYGHPLRMEWDYDLYYENEVGPGEAYVVISGVGSFTGVRRIPYTISDRVEQEIDCDTSVPVVNKKTLKYAVTGAQGELTFAIADTSVATVEAVNGAEVTVKGLKPGITKLIVTAAETDSCYAAEEEFEIHVVPGATTKVRATNLADCMKITWEKVEGATKYDIYRDGEYMLSTSNLYCPDKDARYKNLQKFTYKVVAYTNVNKVKLESTEARTTTYYRVMTVGVNTLSNTQAGKLKVTYTTNPASTGYVVRYGQKADLSDGKTKTIFGANTNSYTITGVKKGTTYYVQVRTFVRKPVDGGGTFDYFSTYSTIQHIKITK